MIRIIYREGVTLIARLIDPRIGPQENHFKTNQGIPNSKQTL